MLFSNDILELLNDLSADLETVTIMSHTLLPITKVFSTLHLLMSGSGFSAVVSDIYIFSTAAQQQKTQNNGIHLGGMERRKREKINTVQLLSVAVSETTLRFNNERNT